MEIQSINPTDLYGDTYFSKGFGAVPYERNNHWLWFFNSVADNLIRGLQPRRMLDAGCAMGMLVEAFWDRGVEAWGVDISEYAIGKVRRDMQAFCRTGSVTEPLVTPEMPQSFDLVTCIEVLEHLPPGEVRLAAEQLCRPANRILFSSTPSDYEEPTHFSVRPPIFWIKLFAEFGFSPNLLFDATFLAPHAMLLERREAQYPEEVLALYADRLRFRVALVERESRIGRLDAEALSLNTKLGATARELAEFTAKNLELNDAWRQTGEQLKLFIEKNEEMSQLVGGLSQEHERITKLAAERETALAFIAAERNRLLEQIANLELEQSQIDPAITHELASAREDFSRAQQRVGELQSSLSRTSSALAEIKSSPGWKVVQAYRDWLNDIHNKPWVLRRLHQTAVRVAIGRTAALPVKSAPVEEIFVPPPLAVLEAPRPATSIENRYRDWLRQSDGSSLSKNLDADIAQSLGYRPLISVIVPVFKVPVQVAREMVESVVAQSYPNWELCIVHADPEDKAVAAMLRQFAASDARIKVKTLAENKGISSNSNEALEMAAGEFLALLDHDDMLAPSALLENVRALNENPAYDFLYSDKDQLDENTGERIAPLFKPRWSPEIMLSANYLTHLCVMRAATVREVGAWRTETDGAQDWDLFLRVIRRGGKVRHIPKVLYHWRRISTSVALRGVSAKPYVIEAQRHCLSEHLHETGWNAEPLQLPDHRWKLSWMPEARVRVSVLCDVRRRDPEWTKQYAQKLRSATQYPDFELVFATERPAPEAEPGVRFVKVPPGASPSSCLQTAADSSTSPVLVFLEAGMEPSGGEWLEELAGPLVFPEVGLVGVKSVDPATALIRHAGICFNPGGMPDYIFSNQPEHIYAEFGGAGWYRNWSAVSGACFALRRDDWNAVKGFQTDLEFPRYDIDLCLRLQLERGLRIVYNPFARMLQSQPAALELWQGTPEKGAAYFHACFPGGDPYFNPNLTSSDGVTEYRKVNRGAGHGPRDLVAENRALVNGFDFSERDVAKSRAATSGPNIGVLNAITWILPEFSVAFYGGVHTILRFADYFFRKHQVHSQFLFPGPTHPVVYRGRIGEAFPELAADCGIYRINGYGDLVAIPPTDGVISTLWTTAYSELFFNQARRKFYFVQDYEPLFYPAGSVSALAEATYGFGYIGLCNTVELKNLYSGFGAPAEYFDPEIDTSIFFPGERAKRNRYRLFCYARPSHPRNCFELLGAALKKVKERFGQEVEIVTAGAQWDPAADGLEGVVENLGLLGYRETGALYRVCDAGTVMMMTAHPSYLPLELMSCGALVITNANPSTAWLLKDNENCLLAAPSATAFADRIEEGLRNKALRRRVTENALQMAQTVYSDWDGQQEKIYRYMQSVC